MRFRIATVEFGTIAVNLDTNEQCFFTHDSRCLIESISSILFKTEKGYLKTNHDSLRDCVNAIEDAIELLASESEMAKITKHIEDFVGVFDVTPEQAAAFAIAYQQQVKEVAVELVMWGDNHIVIDAASVSISVAEAIGLVKKLNATG